MVERTERPHKTDRYGYCYNRKDNGGLSTCCEGNGPDKECNVLPNCCGYATGRFNEAYNEDTGYGAMKYSFLNCHARDFVTRAKSHGMLTGPYPATGSIMVLSGGSSKLGHVCFVERVVSANSVIITESSWTNKTVFKRKTRNRLLGNWSTNPLYKLEGFIYLPSRYNNPYSVPEHTLKKGDKGTDVKWLQYQLQILYPDLSVDGSFGGKTLEALRTFQLTHGLSVDGKAGRATKTALMNAAWEVF